jgi:protein-S-isoprenylcysteine O-methyltransferase Ste14
LYCESQYTLTSIAGGVKKCGLGDQIHKTVCPEEPGVLSCIRHLLHASRLLLAWGAFFKAPRWVTGALAGAASALLFETAKVEERENVTYFGLADEDYMRRRRRFLPFVF